MQTASAAEELASQATLLGELLTRFKLKADQERADAYQSQVIQPQEQALGTLEHSYGESVHQPVHYE